LGTKFNPGRFGQVELDALGVDEQQMAVDVGMVLQNDVGLRELMS